VFRPFKSNESGMHGVLIRREFWCFLLYFSLVIIPYILHALGIVSINFLLNPFTVFFVVFIVVMVAVYSYIPKNPYIMLIAIIFLALIAFVYVWCLYIQPVIRIPVIPI